MNDRITRYIQKLKAEKKKQKQAAAFITAMSLVVSGTVSWQLHGIGTAMIDENLAEKTDENIHQLSDDTLLCENPQIWENDLPDITGSNIRESVALIAGSQIGYEENTENFILDEDGESHKCYTRYGDWYGNPYGEWNTMFTYFCMKYGGVDEDDIPFGSGCWAWSVDLEKENLLIPMDRGSPQRGDVLLLDSDMDGRADRSGIVSELANEDDEKLIKVIEGNVGGTVAEQEYSIDDEHIIGFLTLADNAETAVQTEETEAEVPIVMKFSGISESGVEVMASADVGTFPEGTVMTVSDIDHDEAVKAAKDSFDADTEMLDAVAVDISFSDKDGNEIEPCADTTVQVQIILPDEMKLHDGEFSLLHIADSGDVQKVENADVSETGAEFVAEEFSLYVIVSNPEYIPDNTQPTIITQYPMSNGSNGGNSADNPLIIGTGELIEVWYDGNDYAECKFTVSGNDFLDDTHILDRQYKWGWSDTTGADKIENNVRKASFKGSRISQDGDKCYIVLRKNDVDVEKLYVKVVEKAIFKVEDEKRTLFTDNTITANKGDKFTLSLNGYNSGAISPKSDNDTEVEYDISSCLKRGVPSYINNNTYVEFTCMEEGVQKITVNEKEITVLIGNPPFIVEGDKRTPLDTYLSENFYYTSWNNGGERVIYAYPNDKFTVSVNGYAAHLVSVDSNSVITRSDPKYSNGNTNFEINCNSSGTSYIYFRDRVNYGSGANAYTVKVVVRDHNNDIYMMHNGNRELIEEVLKEENKYDFRDPLTIYALEGEKFTLSVTKDGGADNLIGQNYDSNYLNRSAATYKEGNLQTYVEFECLHHGETTMKVNNRDVKVVITHPMYVKTNIMERDIDRVTEWVSAQSWMPKHNGYNPNSETYPYQLYDNDTMTLRIPKLDLSDNAKLVIDDTSAFTIQDGSLALSGDNINVTLLAHNNTGADLTVPIKLMDGSNTIRTMYVKIPRAKDNLLDHADIEIADGGKYTVTKLKRNSDGTIEKVITEYKAYVSGVNSSELYESIDDEKTCQFYKSNGDLLEKYDSSVKGYRSDQYWVDPTIPKGSTQYEFTSKYNLTTGHEYWSNTKYYANEVDHVIFDVKITLEPSKETVYKKNASKWEKDSEKTFTSAEIAEKTKELESVKFRMDHQDVLDAYNKCPNHSGLDFTIMAFSALVEFDLNKELTGGNVEADQFEFGIYDENNVLVDTAKNNADGIITFNSLHFEKPGTYNYKIKEIVSANKAENIIYDNSEKALNITVSKSPDNQLTAELDAEISNYVFTNHTTYTLPATGGTGVIPYTVTGIAIITGAAALLIRIRRKEEN